MEVSLLRIPSRDAGPRFLPRLAAPIAGGPLLSYCSGMRLRAPRKRLWPPALCRGNKRARHPRSAKSPAWPPVAGGLDPPISCVLGSRTEHWRFLVPVVRSPMAVALADAVRRGLRSDNRRPTTDNIDTTRTRMMPLPFAHLHCHSHYSLLDGAGTIDGLFERAKALGMNALALTDHGNLHGALEFYQQGQGRWASIRSSATRPTSPPAAASTRTPAA